MADGGIRSALFSRKRAPRGLAKAYHPASAGPIVSDLLSKTVSVQRDPGVSATPPVFVSRETESSLTIYLREAAEVALLTPAEEVQLAQRIQSGDASAREHMIRANLRLVVKISREYEGFGLPLLDMVNEGNIGLMRAVERFDPTRGCKFSTYAALWIRQAVRRGLANQSKTIRLPINLIDRLSLMNRTVQALREKYGRPPSDDEIALAMELPVKKIRDLQQASMHTSSLDASISSSEDSSTLGELLEDASRPSPYQVLEDKTRYSLLHELMNHLNARESVILRYRFGLDGGTEKTLEQVGARFGVTRERIRQLQNVALQKLKRLLEEREAVPQTAMA